ncbi:MAG: hypothetical protein H7Y18_06165 [Clostridiaceae bacterium]|nr:hypothetical protein [Clostridiaceae bacterium]
MLKCILDGVDFLASDIKDEYGVYKEVEREEIRLKGYSNALICPCCNKPVRLGAGNIRMPYFAHKDKRECIYSKEFSEDIQKIKLKLYFILKANFNGNVAIDYFHNDKLFSSILLEKDNKKLAIEFFKISQIRRIKSKIESYQNLGNSFLAIIIDNPSVDDIYNKNSLEYYVSENNPDGIVIYVSNDKFELHKFIRPYLRHQKRLKKIFDIDLFNISIDGLFNIKFGEELNDEKMYQEPEMSSEFIPDDYSCWFKPSPIVEAELITNNEIPCIEIKETMPKYKKNERVFDIVYSVPINQNESLFVYTAKLYYSNIKNNKSVNDYKFKLGALIQNHYSYPNHIKVLKDFAQKEGLDYILKVLEKCENIANQI